MVIQDESGNKVTVNIEAPIDKTPPKTPTIKNPYENKWTNKPYKLTLTSSDSLSGLSYFQYKYDSSASWVTK